MAVLAERQRSGTGSSNSQVVERGGRLNNKPGGATVDGKPSSQHGPTFWRCGKQGHVQRNCKERNSSGAVASVAPNGEPPASLLSQNGVEAKVQGKEKSQTDTQINSMAKDSV